MQVDIMRTVGGRSFYLKRSQVLFLFQLEIHEPSCRRLLIDRDRELLSRHGRLTSEFYNPRAVEIVLCRSQDNISLASSDFTQPQDNNGCDGDNGDDNDGGEDEKAHR